MRERALSTVISYVLALGIVALLTTLLFVSMGGFVDGERQQTTRSTLEVVGNAIAADIETADRLAQASGDSGTVELAAAQPERVAGTQYTIAIEQVAADGRYAITLRSSGPDVTVTVPVTTRTGIDETTVDGGDLEIVYEGDALVIRNA